MSASAVLRRAREAGASLWLDGDQLGVSGPVPTVREILAASANCEPEIAAALWLANQAFSEDLVPPSGIAIAWETERQLRAELAALMAEVATRLGDNLQAALLDRAIREPYHTLAASLAFFHEVALSLRTSQASREFVANLLPSRPGE
ncbi:hypothetical protein AB4Z27_26000 [Cupriavidus sp. KB_39]|uniref:hypothetical protein n=1 Tax=Cupriavidus sp. KB_39 TaxID=3233036 RepID=UPI003F9013D1